MAAETTNALDDEFKAFLDEVDKLSIAAEVEGNDHGDKNENETEAKLPKVPHLSAVSISTQQKCVDDAKRKSQSEKRNMISNANGNQRAWSEFKKLDLSSNDSSASNDKGTEGKVSFQIKSTKDKKKKTKKKTTVKKQLDQENQPNHISGSSGTTIPSVGNMDESDGCPRWILIIDTCCLLNCNAMNVQKLIDMANNSLKARTKSQNQKNVAYMAATVEEPIDIVIPFKVWSELEFQSKSDDNNVAYAARTAIRMLRDEMESKDINSCSVLRSQSLLESREAASKYLPTDSHSTNDDHILACAMMENERIKGPSTTAASKIAGGVVMVTLDNNLTCKGYANGLKVDSPSKFHEYYQMRMASLRQRAAGSLVR